MHCETVSGCKYPVAAYDAKAEAEAYIHTLPIKSALYAPATFMQNLAGIMAPRPVLDQPAPAQDAIFNMFLFCSECGYYGPDSERLVNESIAEVTYKLTALDEYIAAAVKLV